MQKYTSMLKKRAVDELMRIALNDPSILSNYFVENQFDRRNIIAILNDDFASNGVEYAVENKRVFFIQESKTGFNQEILSDKKLRTVTFFGQKDTFSYDLISEFSNLDVPISIFTAENDAALKCLIKATNSQRVVQVKNPLVSDLKSFRVSDTKKANEICNRIEQADALLVNVHGDILCAHLGAAVLCSINNRNNAGKQVRAYMPSCTVTEKCFRKNRFDSNIPFRKIFFRDLNAKIMFINTCGGFSLTGSKYENFPHIMPLESIKSGALVYISNRIILRNIREDIYLFWALLKHFKNISVSTYYLNKIRGGEKALVMLGDGILDVDLKNEPICQCDRITNLENRVIFDFDSINSKTLITKYNMPLYSKDDNGKIQDCVMYVDTPLESSGGCYHDKGKINVVLQFHDEHPKTARLVVTPKKVFHERIKEIGILSGLLSVPNHLSLPPNIIEDLRKEASIINQKITLLFDSLKLPELNGAKYLFVDDFTLHLKTKLIAFYKLFITSIMTHSVNSDTHLILNEMSLISQESVPNLSGECKLCGGSVYQMVYYYGMRDDGFVSIICPLCEIVSVRNFSAKLVDVVFPDTILPGTENALKVICNIDDSSLVYVRVGVALIDAFEILNISIDSCEKIKIEKSVSIPRNMHPGMYYLRCVLVYDGCISISHKRVFVESLV